VTGSEAAGCLTILVLAWSLLTGAVALAVLIPARGDADFHVPAGTAISVRLVPGRRVSDAGKGHRWIGLPLTERGSAQGAIWMFSRWGAH